MESGKRGTWQVSTEVASNESFQICPSPQCLARPLPTTGSTRDKQQKNAMLATEPRGQCGAHMELERCDKCTGKTICSTGDHSPNMSCLRTGSCGRVSDNATLQNVHKIEMKRRKWTLQEYMIVSSRGGQCENAYIGPRVRRKHQHHHFSYKSDDPNCHFSHKRQQTTHAISPTKLPTSNIWKMTCRLNVRSFDGRSKSQLERMRSSVKRFQKNFMVRTREMERHDNTHSFTLTTYTPRIRATTPQETNEDNGMDKSNRHRAVDWNP